MAAPLKNDRIWFEKHRYDEAEKQYYIKLAKVSVRMFELYSIDICYYSSYRGYGVKYSFLSYSILICLMLISCFNISSGN